MEHFLNNWGNALLQNFNTLTENKKMKWMQRSCPFQVFVNYRIHGCTICLWRWAPWLVNLAQSLSNWLENSFKWMEIQVSVIGPFFFFFAISVLYPILDHRDQVN